MAAFTVRDLVTGKALQVGLYVSTGRKIAPSRPVCWTELLKAPCYLTYSLHWWQAHFFSQNSSLFALTEG